jgi:hypothetical protein
MILPMNGPVAWLNRAGWSFGMGLNLSDRSRPCRTEAQSILGNAFAVWRCALTNDSLSLYAASISGSLVDRCPFGRMGRLEAFSGFGEPAMPVDLPPNKKSPHSAEVTFNLLLDRSLNWLAVIVAAGLLLWVYKLGLMPG